MARSRLLSFSGDDFQYSRGVGVRFDGWDGPRLVDCWISYEALFYFAEGHRLGIRNAFKKYRWRIERLAQEKHARGERGADGYTVWIGDRDLEASAA
jgi:Protein of unknown function (DUF1488)